MKLLTISMALSLIALTFPIAAQTTSSEGVNAAARAPAITPSTMTEGEVRKVDKEAGKITLRHGPIANLEMPAMTMVFRVKDPSLLDKVKAGERVRFVATKEDGALIVTQIDPAP